MELKKGSDFRKKEFRREVFLRFYDFHLKYKSHPGAVYYAFDYLKKNLGLDEEQMYWLAFINGCTQNIVTSYRIFKEFPEFKKVKKEELEKWHRANWSTLSYDTDRRYQKGHFVKMWEDYNLKIGSLSQKDFFCKFCSEDSFKSFDKVWGFVYSNFFMFGRLSTYSYLEYLRIIGLKIDCSNLFIDDLDGSKSHRNGLCIVLGLEKYDWNKENENAKAWHSQKNNRDFLKIEGEKLLLEAKKINKEAEYFTLESTLCCYKSWHRKNRRYPNVYNDMFYERIKNEEKKGYNCDIFWQMRKSCLPKFLRFEDNKEMMGLCKIKQNWYRETGEVLMLDYVDEAFENNFIKKTKQNKQLLLL